MSRTIAEKMEAAGFIGWPETDMAKIARLRADPHAEAVEAMRAKCEEIARHASFPFDINDWITATKREMTVKVALAIADAIAALKAK